MELYQPKGIVNNEEEIKLKKHGIRPTTMRILVLQYLMELNRTTSLLDLEQHFKQADRSTLYRTLKTFEQKGIVHKVDDGSGSIKYGLCLEHCNCTIQDQHFHFHCEKCQETYCLTNMVIPTIYLPANFKMKEANLVLKGICSNCS